MISLLISSLIVCLFLAIALFWLLRKVSNDYFSGAKSFDWFLFYCKMNYLKGNSINIALLDIDNFKSINKFGVSNGDKALRAFVSFCKKSLPSHFSIARYRHGDEFVLISKDTQITEFDQEILSLQAKLMEFAIFLNNEKDKITIEFTYSLKRIKLKKEIEKDMTILELELMHLKQKKKGLN